MKRIKTFRTKKYYYTFTLNNMYFHKKNFLVCFLPYIGITYYESNLPIFKYHCGIVFRFIVWDFRIIIAKYRNKKSRNN